MTHSLAPYVLTNQNSPCFWINDNLWMPLVGSFLTANRFTFLEQLCGTGIGGPPTHTHEQDEAIYVIEGELTLIAGPERVTAKAGTFAYLPAQCVHSFRVDSPTARLLNFYLPGGFERTITELAPPALARTLPPAGAAPGGRGEPSDKEKALFKEVGMSWLALPDVLRQEKR